MFITFHSRGENSFKADLGMEINPSQSNKRDIKLIIRYHMFSSIAIYFS